MIYQMARVFGIAPMALVLLTCSAQAQLYPSPFANRPGFGSPGFGGAGWGSPGFGNHYVPHTTTHYHYIPHGNHIGVVPHTTTHFDRVSGYGRYGWGPSVGYGTRSSFYSSQFTPNWVRQQSLLPSGHGHHHAHGHQRYWGYGHCHPF